MLFQRHTEEEARAFVREAQSDLVREFWTSVVRTIATTETDELVGLCGLVVQPAREDAEMWYMVDPRRWGQGIATQAARQLLDLGFEAYNLHRLWACCVPANPASARVLEKIGMRREGYQRLNLKFHGEWMDTLLYAILREEWLALKI